MSAFRNALRAVLPDVRETKRVGSTAAASQESLRGDPAVIRRAVAALPNTSAVFPAREDFIKVAYALRAAYGPDLIEEARADFQDFAGRWIEGTNDPEYTDAEFDRCKEPYRIGASWIFDKAAKHGSFNRADQWFEAPAEDGLFPTKAPTLDPRPGLRFMTFAEAADALTTTGPPLVKGLLDCGTMSVVYGDSNAGKTFVVLALSHHVATGTALIGKQVTRAKVAYVAAEGGRGIRRRFAALDRQFGAAPWLHLLAHPINLYDPNADVQPLIEAVLALATDNVSVGLVVIDTLARAIAGADENSAKDMGLFVKHVDQIRQATGAHVLVVHHTGKDASKGARGSSVLRAATDTEIEIVKGGTLNVTKQRDLDGDLSIAFTLITVELGRDDDGDPVTSCIVRFEPAAIASPASKLTGLDAEVAEAVDALVAGECRKGAKRQDVERWLDEKGISGTSDTVRSRLRSLAKKGVLVKVAEGVWAPRHQAANTRAARHFDDKMSSVAEINPMFA